MEMATHPPGRSSKAVQTGHTEHIMPRSYEEGPFDAGARSVRVARKPGRRRGGVPGAKGVA
jgi:hypothetical protein